MLLLGAERRRLDARASGIAGFGAAEEEVRGGRRVEGAGREVAFVRGKGALRVLFFGGSLVGAMVSASFWRGYTLNCNGYRVVVVVVIVRGRLRGVVFA